MATSREQSLKKSQIRMEKQERKRKSSKYQHKDSERDLCARSKGKYFKYQQRDIVVKLVLCLGYLKTIPSNK